MAVSQETVTKSDFAYKILRRDILEARLAPKSPLKLGVIRETYGLGWTPLREALSRLEAEHLVQSTANKGYVVAPVSREEMADLTKTKDIIELQLLREAMEFGDQEWEAGIVAAHYRLSREVSPLENIRDLETFIAWTHLHDTFHSSLMAANRSPWLSRFYDQVRDHMRRHVRALRALLPHSEPDAFFDALKKSPALETAYSLAPHTALMEAVINRRFVEATELMIHHNELTMRAYTEVEQLVHGEKLP
jgi:DNA-binding GntR family transcriptional regulator